MGAGVAVERELSGQSGTKGELWACLQWEAFVGRSDGDASVRSITVLQRSAQGLEVETVTACVL